MNDEESKEPNGPFDLIKAQSKEVAVDEDNLTNTPTLRKSHSQGDGLKYYSKRE